MNDLNLDFLICKGFMRNGVAIPEGTLPWEQIFVIFRHFPPERTLFLSCSYSEWRALHGRGHHCSCAKPATPLNIKLSVARRSASADDVAQTSSLLAAGAAPHAPPRN